MGTRARLTGLAMSATLSVSVLVSTGVVAADTGPRAELDGRSIPLRSVGKHHCHDLDYPRITCFATRKRLGAELDAAAVARGITALSYVRIYEDEAYQGSSMALSQGYANLGSIGWNDRISSFRVLNDGAGVFREHAGPSGASYAFCCDDAVTNLGSWNDIISAVTGSA